MEEVQNQYPGQLQSGDTGDYIRIIQYMLAWIGQYENEVPQPAIDGIFGPATRAAVLAAQQRFGLPQTGVVDFNTWDEIYDQFSGIETTAWRDPEDFPYTNAILTGTAPRARYSRSSTMTQFPGTTLSRGNQDPVRQEVIR